MAHQEISIRPAVAADAAAIRGVYAPYVEHASHSFEYTVPTVAEMARRIAETTAHYPYLVCEVDGRVIGFAYAHQQRERAAYQWNAELSVYLEESWGGHGIGKALYGALLDILTAQGYYNVYAGITSDNSHSVHFHEALGFRLLGEYACTGFKEGVWYGAVWYEKALRDREGTPQPTIPVSQLDADLMQDILARWGQKILLP